MLFKNAAAAIAAITMLLAGQAAAAATGILVATDPCAACQAPNNGDYGPGHDCKYTATGGGNDIIGTCVQDGNSCAGKGNGLGCVPNQP